MLFSTSFSYGLCSDRFRSAALHLLSRKAKNGRGRLLSGSLTSRKFLKLSCLIICHGAYFIVNVMVLCIDVVAWLDMKGGDAEGLHISMLEA